MVPAPSSNTFVIGIFPHQMETSSLRSLDGETVVQMT
jgi:hypothetical protein